MSRPSSRPSANGSPSVTRAIIVSFTILIQSPQSTPHLPTATNEHTSRPIKPPDPPKTTNQRHRGPLQSTIPTRQVKQVINKKFQLTRRNQVPVTTALTDQGTHGARLQLITDIALADRPKVKRNFVHMRTIYDFDYWKEQSEDVHHRVYDVAEIPVVAYVIRRWPNLECERHDPLERESDRERERER